MTAGGEAFFSSQYLTDCNPMLPEQLVISVYKFGLTDSRKQLSAVYTVQLS